MQSWTNARAAIVAYRRWRTAVSFRRSRRPDLYQRSLQSQVFIGARTPPLRRGALLSTAIRRVPPGNATRLRALAPKALHAAANNRAGRLTPRSAALRSPRLAHCLDRDRAARAAEIKKFGYSLRVRPRFVAARHNGKHARVLLFDAHSEWCAMALDDGKGSPRKVACVASARCAMACAGGGRWKALKPARTVVHFRELSDPACTGPGLQVAAAP